MLKDTTQTQIANHRNWLQEKYNCVATLGQDGPRFRHSRVNAQISSNLIILQVPKNRRDFKTQPRLDCSPPNFRFN